MPEKAREPEVLFGYLVDSTGCEDLRDAIGWIAEGHPFRQDTNHHQVLLALIKAEERGIAVEPAIRRVVRELARSELDTADRIFGWERILPPERYRQALDTMASKCPGSSLSRLSSEAVFLAHNVNNLVMETLCAIAGFSYRELVQRCSVVLPKASSDRWSKKQVEAAFSVISEIVEQHGVKTVDSAPALPIEFMFDPKSRVSGWEKIEEFWRIGIPYEILIAQRVVGGSWGAHRNRVSTQVTRHLARELSVKLSALGVFSQIARSVGGELTRKEVESLTGLSGFVGLVAFRASGQAGHAVVFSLARDGGTVRSTTARLLGIGNVRIVPVSLVLAGKGWSQRNETAKLAQAFEAQIYSDKDLGQLAKDIHNSLAENGG